METVLTKKPRVLLQAGDMSSSSQEEAVIEMEQQTPPKQPRKLLYAADEPSSSEEEEKPKKQKKPSTPTKPSTPKKASTPKKSSTTPTKSPAPKKTSKKPVLEESEEEVKPKKSSKTPKKTSKKPVSEEESDDEEEEGKPKRVRTEKVLGMEEAEKLLQILVIKSDKKTLTTMQKQEPKRYDTLINLLSPLTVLYSERTPIGRIFAYLASDGFTVLRDSPLVSKIVGYEKKDLNVRSIFSELDEDKQKQVLAVLTKKKSDKEPNDAQLLYALIACQMIKTAEPDHSDPCQKCVLRDDTRQETYWIASKEAKAKIGEVFVLKLKKKVTAQNIVEETKKLDERRATIVSLCGSAIVPSPEKKKKDKKKDETPKKRKKEEEAEEEEESPKKKKKKDPSPSKKEDAVATPPKKKAIVTLEMGPDFALKPLTTPIKNGNITINKIERTVAHDHGFIGTQTAAQIRDKISKQKLKLMALDNELDPRIKWFNENCGVD